MISDTTNQVSFYQTLADLVEVSSRVAAIRLAKSRDGVLFSRRYLADLSSIFDEVRISYERQVKQAGRFSRVRGKQAVTFLSHNGRKVMVFLSANTRLYGDLMRETFEIFVTHLSERPEFEVVIVGRVGRELFTRRFPKKPFTYFSFPDSGWDKEHFEALLTHIVAYEVISVYHGRFLNVLTQEATAFVLSSHLLLDQEKSTLPHKEYYFEPSLELVLPFFERGIFRALLAQTIRESQLAKYGARLTALTLARERIRQKAELAAWRESYEMHQLTNKRQLNYVNGVISR